MADTPESIKETLSKLEKYDVVEIDWLDTIACDRTWVHEDDIDLATEETHMVHRLVGAVFKMTDDTLFLMTLFRPLDGMTSGIIGTPISTIKRVEKLSRANTDSGNKRTKKERKGRR